MSRMVGEAIAARRRFRDARRRAARLQRRLIAAAVGSAFAAAAFANPTGGSVVSGSASIVANGKTLTITNAPGTIINWQQFSISQDEITRFIQQNANSAVLNRVVGQDPTQILGQLLSNGRVYLINPNGLVFGKGAVIDVAGFAASTLNLSNADFLSGRHAFSGAGTEGKITNLGTIRTQEGGHVYLVAPNVENAASGVISSPKGEVVIAAGRTVELVNARTPDIRVEFTAPATEAVNAGHIVANSGRIGIYGTLVRNSGLVSASRAETGDGGKIVFRAVKDVTLDATSRIEANGAKGGSIEIKAETGTLVAQGVIEAKGEAGKGGDIALLGNRVAVNAATVDASGTAGGGTILVGGDFQGKNPAVQNAQRTVVTSTATLRADATASGDGGKVILWADGDTRFYGTVTARGGPQGGNGGFVEVSGKDVLLFRGNVDTTAPLGEVGHLLLDPGNISITAASTPNGNFSADTGDGLWSFTEGGSSESVGAPEIIAILNNTNLTLQASNNITLLSGADINYSNNRAGASFELQANNAIDIQSNANIRSTNGALNITLRADHDGNGSGDLTLGSGSLLKSAGGNIVLSAGSVTGAGSSLVDAGAGDLSVSAKVDAGSAATALRVVAANLAANAQSGNVFVAVVQGDVALRDIGSVTNNAGGSYFNVSVGNASTSGNLVVGNGVATLSTTANVTLVANGSVELNAAVGNASVTFTRVEATGAGGNITAGGTAGNYVSGGNVILAANASVGTTANRVFTAATNLAVNAGTGNVYVAERDDVALRDLSNDRASALTNNAGGSYFNVSVGNASTSGNLVVGGNVGAMAGNLIIELPAANALVTINSGFNVSASGMANLTADRFTVLGNIVATGANAITLRPTTITRGIQLGTGADESSSLGLDNNEVGRFYASNVTIGGVDQQGSISVVGAANFSGMAGTGNLTLLAGNGLSTTGTIAVNANLTAPGNITLSTANGSITFGQTAAVTGVRTTGTNKTIALVATNQSVTSANANLDVDTGTTGNLTITAGRDVGTSAGAIDVRTTNLAVNAGGGNVYVRTNGDVTLRDIGTIVNNASAAYFNVSSNSASSGNITVAGNVAAGSSANVTLTANGVAIDANVGSTGNVFTVIQATTGNITRLASGTNNLVLGGDVLLKAQGEIGTTAAPVRTGASNLAAAAGGNTYVVERDSVALRDLNRDGVSITNNAGALRYFNVGVDSASTGTITISGPVATASTANVTITANAVAIDANVGNVGNDFTLIRATTGSITRLTTGTNNLVSGNNVLLKADAGSIGATGTPVRTSAANLAANAGSGSIYLEEVSDVTLRDLTRDGVAVTNNASAGPFQLTTVDGSIDTGPNALRSGSGVKLIANATGTTARTLTIGSGGILAAGQIDLGAADGLTINGNVRTSTGNINLVSGTATGMSSGANLSLPTEPSDTTGTIDINAPVKTDSGSIVVYASGAITQPANNTTAAGLQGTGQLTVRTFSEGTNGAVINLQNTHPTWGNSNPEVVLETRRTIDTSAPAEPSTAIDYAASDIDYKSITGLSLKGIGTAANYTATATTQSITVATFNIQAKNLTLIANAGDINVNASIEKSKINRGNDGGSLNLLAAGDINLNANSAVQGVSIGKRIGTKDSGDPLVEYFNHDLRLVATNNINIRGGIWITGNLSLRADASSPEVVSLSGALSSKGLGNGSGGVSISNPSTADPLEVRALNLIVGEKNGTTFYPVQFLKLNAGSGTAAAGANLRLDSILRAGIPTTESQSTTSTTVNGGLMQIILSGEMNVTAGSINGISTAGGTVRNSAFAAITGSDVYICHAAGCQVNVTSPYNAANTIRLQGGTATANNSAGGGAVAAADAFILASNYKTIIVDGDIIVAGGTANQVGSGQASASAFIDPIQDLVIRAGGSVVLQAGRVSGGASPASASAKIVNEGYISIFLGGGGTGYTFNDPSSGPVALSPGLILIGNGSSGLFDAQNVSLPGTALPITISGGGIIRYTPSGGDYGPAFVQTGVRTFDESLLRYLIFSQLEGARSDRIRRGLGDDDIGGAACE